MQQIEMSLVIYSRGIILEGFEEFKKIVKSNIEFKEDRAIVTFEADDEYVMKEFSNYVIALSAAEV
ncbi:hypothetical protein [Clostridium sp. YIM B02555]|uniref:hypothetical protein n=1 Tax=Clostridium sp. YIM B02555 TaxID=2911968 RepID=UPI001EEF766F|nr:hypothetical protein [Clostridium sp. YIM B02555]